MNLDKILYYAEKSVIFPVAPLYDRATHVTPRLPCYLDPQRPGEVHPPPHLPRVQPEPHALAERRGAERLPVHLLQHAHDARGNREPEGSPAAAGRRDVSGRLHEGNHRGGLPAPDEVVRDEGPHGDGLDGAAALPVRRRPDVRDGAADVLAVGGTERGVHAGGACVSDVGRDGGVVGRSCSRRTTPGRRAC